jgi:hypothetical protein
LAGSSAYTRASTDGQPEHQLDQVDAVDLLGDRVLDLQARVHLEEGRLFAHRVVDELDRASAAVPDARREPTCGLVESLPDVVRQRRGRSLLDDLLVPALQ